LKGKSVVARPREDDKTAEYNQRKSKRAGRLQTGRYRVNWMIMVATMQSPVVRLLDFVVVELDAEGAERVA
jgi:hypothetical protein